MLCLSPLPQSILSTSSLGVSLPSPFSREPLCSCSHVTSSSESPNAFWYIERKTNSVDQHSRFSGVFPSLPFKPDLCNLKWFLHTETLYSFILLKVLMLFFFFFFVSLVLLMLVHLFIYFTGNLNDTKYWRHWARYNLHNWIKLMSLDHENYSLVKGNLFNKIREEMSCELCVKCTYHK